MTGEKNTDGSGGTPASLSSAGQVAGFHRHVFLNLYFSGLSFGLGFLYLASRIGLPGAIDPLPEVLSAVSIAALVFLLPSFFLAFIPRHHDFYGTISNCGAWGVLAFLIVLSYLPIAIGPALWIIAGLAMTAAVVIALRREAPLLRSTGWAVVSLAIFGLLFALIVFPRAHPPFANEQAYLGYLFDDGYYHMALTQMLIGYGVPSIGIDGLLWDPYHVGSHYIVGRLTVTSGGEVAHSFPAFMHLLFLPLLLRSLVAATLDAEAGASRSLNVIIAAVLSMVVCYASLTNDIIFISPSYLVSIAAAAAVAPFLLLAARRRLPLNSFVWAGLLAAIPILISLKVSSGQLFALLVIYVVWRLPPSRGKAISLTLAAVALTVIFLPMFASSRDHAEQLIFSPLKYYLTDEVLVWRRPFFFLIYSIFSLAYIGCRLAAEGALARGGLKPALREGRLVDAESLLFVVVAGYFPGTVLFHPQLIWLYFYDFQAWIALPLVAGTMMSKGAAQWNGERHRGYVFLPVLVLLLLAPLLDSLGSYLMKRTGRFLSEIVETHVGLAGGTLPPRQMLAEREQRLVEAISDPARLLALFSSTSGLPQRYSVAAGLARQLRSQFGRDIAVYIPADNRDYWRGENYCYQDTMFFPAILGIPLVDGEPPLPCRITHLYGFRPYELRTSNRSLGYAELCERSRQRGFSRVYRLESLDRPERNRLLQC